MTLANAVTWVRVGLFVLFLGAIIENWQVAARVSFVGAWSLDVVDGWVARAFKQESVFGYVFDKVVDRMVLAVGLLMLLALGAVPWWAVFLATKDLLVAPLGVLLYWRQQPVRGFGDIGKVMSLLQGCGLLWVWWQFPYSVGVVSVLAIAGVAVAVRFFRQHFTAPAPPRV